MQRFDAQVAAITPATPSIHVLRLAIPDAGFRFLPGQWVDLSIEVDGSIQTSGYSITTSPIHQGEIELFPGPTLVPVWTQPALAQQGEGAVFRR